MLSILKDYRIDNNLIYSEYKQSGVLIVKHVNTNRYLISYSKDLYFTRNSLLSQLKHKKSKVNELQELYNIDDELSLKFIFTGDVEEAIKIKQEILDKCLNTGVLFNRSLVAENSKKGIKKNSEITKELISKQTLHKKKHFIKEK